MRQTPQPRLHFPEPSREELDRRASFYRRVAAVVRDKESAQHFAKLARDCQAQSDSMIQATAEAEGDNAITRLFPD